MNKEAVQALGNSYRGNEPKTVARILGDEGMKLVPSGDPIIDYHEREWFLSLFREGHEVVFESEERAVLQLGKEG